jgi:putative transposase
MLNVSTSGYYEWLGRPESPRETRNRELMKLIAAIHGESRGTYGWPRVHAELVLGLGEQVNRKRVARLEARLGALERQARRREWMLATVVALIIGVAAILVSHYLVGF